jgi:anion-transporting  ArsA/GET3 family ATPase
MASLLDRRMVFVTGKGGVGKTVVAAALGLLAARAGRRAVVCELSGAKRLPGLLGRLDGGGPELISIDAETARSDWLRRELHSGAAAGLLGRSRAFDLLTAAAPGLAELLTIGKVWDLVDGGEPGRAGYEVAIVDGPSTGQALALLEAPRTYAGVARAGPVHSRSLMIEEFLADRARTAVVAVALPEEMPVNETLQLGTSLTALGPCLELVVLNCVLPRRYREEEAGRLRAVEASLPDGERAAVRLALAGHERALDQSRERDRLCAGLTAPVATLPFLFEPELGVPELEALAASLAEAVS